jgi:hypothetical protein
MAKHTILPKHRQFLLNPPTVALNFEVGRSPFASATLGNLRSSSRSSCVYQLFGLGMTNVAAASKLLKPYDASQMRCYPVSTWVNHVANDDAEWSAPVKLAEFRIGSSSDKESRNNGRCSLR